MNRIENILDEVYQVNLTMKEKISAPNGILHVGELNNSKRRLLSFATDYLRDEFVQIEQKFPKEEISEVDLTVDFVVMDGEEYRRLRKIIDKIVIDYENK